MTDKSAVLHFPLLQIQSPRFKLPSFFTFITGTDKSGIDGLYSWRYFGLVINVDVESRPTCDILSS